MRVLAEILHFDLGVCVLFYFVFLSAILKSRLLIIIYIHSNLPP